MKTSRYSDPPILSILRQADGGVAVAELCREYRLSRASFYKWWAKFGGIGASMISQMKSIEEENRRTTMAATDQERIAPPAHHPFQDARPALGAGMAFHFGHPDDPALRPAMDAFRKRTGRGADAILTQTARLIAEVLPRVGPTFNGRQPA